MGLTGPWRLSAAGLGRPTGWFAEETGMFMCSPVYVAPVLNTHGGGMYSLVCPSGAAGGDEKGMPSL